MKRDRRIADARATVSRDLRAAFRGLSLGREQRALAVQAVLVGVLVWTAILALKESLHWLFREVLHWLEHAPTPWVLLLPLSMGALIVGLIAQYRSEVINFRTEEGEIEELNLVEADGIERAIALYFAADPSVRKGVPTNQTGMEARWQKSTFAMAIRRFVASLATLGSGSSGGLETSAALIGENEGDEEFSENEGRLLHMFVFFLFGMTAGSALGDLYLAPVLYAILSLTLARMLPSAVAMLRTHLSPASVLFMGWFGPRGLPSIVLSLVVAGQDVRTAGASLLRIGLIATVLLSIFAHGLTAAPGIKLYARQIGRLDADAPQFAVAARMPKL